MIGSILQNEHTAVGIGIGPAATWLRTSEAKMPRTGERENMTNRLTEVLVRCRMEQVFDSATCDLERNINCEII